MAEYNPDHWVVLRIEGPTETFYKVLAGWSGSYLYGSSWRLNSGIVRVEETDKHFKFFGSSGSCYVCHKDGYALRMSNGPIYDQLKAKFGDKIELMPEDTDWLSLRHLPAP